MATKALDGRSGGMSRRERNDDDVAAAPTDLSRADNCRLSIIAALHENVRLNTSNELERRVFLEYDDRVDRFERCENITPFGCASNRPVWSLQSADRRVAINADEQALAPLARAKQYVDMPRMEEVEDAIRKH
jgi:hypothetical protein